MTRIAFFFFLQETLITEDELGNLHFIDENYEVVGPGSVYSERALESNAGRSEGGLACLWRRSAPFKVQKVIIEKNFIVIVKEMGARIAHKVIQA